MARRRSFVFGGSPSPEVQRYLKNKRLKPSFHHRDVFGEEHAVAFTVAKATQVDILRTIHQALLKGQAAGLPFARFRKDITPQLVKLGWWGERPMRDPKTGKMRMVQLGLPRRLKTIFWANTRTAHAAGQWDRIERTKTSLPYLLYEMGPSENHRPYHQDKEGIVLPVDDPFWVNWMPPNGWGCQCRVRQVSVDEANRRGISKKPNVPTRRFVNKRTDLSVEIPQGIDPGWHTNPGMLRRSSLEKLLTDKFDQLPADWAQTAVKDVITTPEFTRLAQGKGKITLPVGWLPARFKEELGTKVSTVLLSSESVVKNSRRYPDIKASDYAIVQTAIEQGKQVEARALHSGYIIERGGKWFMAVVKRTRIGHENYLVSLHRIDTTRALRLARGT